MTFKVALLVQIHVKWVLCLGAYGGDGFQIWTAAASILLGWSSSFRAGHGTNNTSPEELIFFPNVMKGLGHEDSCEHGNEHRGSVKVWGYS
jgi:hypothetical protein